MDGFYVRKGPIIGRPKTKAGYISPSLYPSYLHTLAGKDLGGARSEGVRTASAATHGVQETNGIQENTKLLILLFFNIKYFYPLQPFHLSSDDILNTIFIKKNIIFFLKILFLFEMVVFKKTDCWC